MMEVTEETFRCGHLSARLGIIVELNHPQSTHKVNTLLMILSISTQNNLINVVDPIMDQVVPVMVRRKSHAKLPVSRIPSSMFPIHDNRRAIFIGNDNMPRIELSMREGRDK